MKRTYRYKLRLGARIAFRVLVNGYTGNLGLINSSTFVTPSQKIRRGLKKAGELDIPKVFGADDLENLLKTGEVQK